MQHYLVKYCNEYFLLDVDLTRMAKSLPIFTYVFCLDEIHTDSIYECVWKSSDQSHCYGCQPIQATSLWLSGVNRFEIQSVEQWLSDNNLIFNTEPFYSDYPDYPLKCIILTTSQKDDLLIICSQVR